MSTTNSKKNGKTSSELSTQSCSRPVINHSKTRALILDVIRQYGPVTIDQIVAICGDSVGTEVAVRAFDRYARKTPGRSPFYSMQEKVAAGKRRVVTDIISGMCVTKRIKRLSAWDHVSPSEWVINDEHAAGNGGPNETPST